MTTTRICVPPCFAIDHEERELPTGKFIEETRKGRVYEVTPEEFREWLSDANYHSDCAGPGWNMYPQPIGLQSSARATVKRLTAIAKATGVA
jgi:hypothetical protein